MGERCAKIWLQKCIGECGQNGRKLCQNLAPEMPIFQPGYTHCGMRNARPSAWKRPSLRRGCRALRPNRGARRWLPRMPRNSASASWSPLNESDAAGVGMHRNSNGQRDRWSPPCSLHMLWLWLLWLLLWPEGRQQLCRCPRRRNPRCCIWCSWDWHASWIWRRM